MRQNRRRSAGRAKALVLGVVLVALGGCAAPGHRPGGDRVPGDRPTPSLPAPPASPSQPIRTAPPAPSDWVEYAADVTGLRPGPTAYSAIIEVSLTAGRDDCARDDLRVTYQEETATSVTANVVYSSAGNATVGACPDRRPAEVTLTSTAPLAGRSVSLNSMSMWILDGASYRRCDTHLGCTPPADHCAAQWIDLATSGLDVPAHSGRRIRSCDGQWLVLDLDIGASYCAPRDGVMPSCSAPPDVRRWFMRFDGGWRIIASTKRGGCADVKAKAPAFPDQFCQHLEPTAR